MATFDTLTQAGDAIAGILGSLSMPCVLEVMDEVCIELLNKYSKDVTLPKAEAMLLAETDAFTEGEASQQIDVIIEVMKKHGAQNITKAESRDQAEKLWTARRAMGGVMTAPRGAFLAEDVTVPPDQISALLRGVHEIGAQIRSHHAHFGTCRGWQPAPRPAL